MSFVIGRDAQRRSDCAAPWWLDARLELFADQMRELREPGLRELRDLRDLLRDAPESAAGHSARTTSAPAREFLYSTHLLTERFPVQFLIGIHWWRRLVLRLLFRIWHI